ncbi:MAG: hypothetical protein PVJ22_20485 [Desulfobacterales bacterium]|jgi:hypothetical protein
MRFICVLAVFLAVLIAVAPATAVSLEDAKTVVNKPAEPVVEVSGGVRQTITAVHPEPSPMQEETSEAWWMSSSGLVILLMSVWAYFSPKVFMYGRRSWFWRELLGEKATATMIRIISFPVGIAGIIIMITGIITLLEG